MPCLRVTYWAVWRLCDLSNCMPAIERVLVQKARPVETKEKLLHRGWGKASKNSAQIGSRTMGCKAKHTGGRRHFYRS